MIADVNDRSMQVKRVTLDGFDITSVCFYANDALGLARVFETDNEGCIKADENLQPIKIEKHGEVVIELW